MTETIVDPEKVLKEGTLEEAAQALEQLELKESEAEKIKDDPVTTCCFCCCFCC